jgi:Protein of unknown function (DUF1573)
MIPFFMPIKPQKQQLSRLIRSMAQNLIYLQRMKSAFMLLLSLSVWSVAHTQTGVGFREGITVLGTDTIFCPDIQKGDTVEAVFYIANQGTQKFWIFQVHASCQCTAPQYANDTFEPGRLDSVVLYFHSKNTTEPEFEKYAIVLTPLGEKTFYIKGHMHLPDEKNVRPSRMIRVTNKILP